ncbi:MAG: FeoA family protein [Kiritimatiellia bacterium]|nr:FeoA family protein [Kiritimatiellia bacterium]
MTVSEMKVGDAAVVKGYRAGHDLYRAKLLALGFTRGAVFELTGVAPMGDPMRLRVRGYELSLRREEAEVLEIEQVVPNRPQPPAAEHHFEERK